MTVVSPQALNVHFEGQLLPILLDGYSHGLPAAAVDRRRYGPHPVDVAAGIPLQSLILRQESVVFHELQEDFLLAVLEVLLRTFMDKILRVLKVVHEGGFRQFIHIEITVEQPIRRIAVYELVKSFLTSAVLHIVTQFF